MELKDSTYSVPRLINALIDLYLYVKVRSKGDIENFSKDKFEEEKKGLQGTDPLIIINYIKSSVEILLSLKDEENRVKYKEQLSNREETYEEQLQKLEAETRSHIRVLV